MHIKDKRILQKFAKFVVMKRFNFSAFTYLLFACFFLACEEETAPVEIPQEQEETIIEPDMRYGFDFNLKR